MSLPQNRILAGASTFVSLRICRIVRLRRTAHGDIPLYAGRLSGQMDEEDFEAEGDENDSAERLDF